MRNSSFLAERVDVLEEQENHSPFNACYIYIYDNIKILVS